jgi:hypothetical protein
VARAEYEASAEARGRAVILFNEEVGHLPADFKDWKAHMSIHSDRPSAWKRAQYDEDDRAIKSM